MVESKKLLQVPQKRPDVAQIVEEGNDNEETQALINQSAIDQSAIIEQETTPIEQVRSDDPRFAFHYVPLVAKTKTEKELPRRRPPGA